MKFPHIQDMSGACLCLEYIKKACQCQEVSQERCDKDVKNKLSQLEGDVLSRAASTVSFCLTVSSAWLMLYWEDWLWLHASICRGFPMMLCRSLPSTVLISINMMCIYTMWGQDVFSLDTQHGKSVQYESYSLHTLSLASLNQDMKNKSNFITTSWH